jgi:hypothetical protein
MNAGMHLWIVWTITLLIFLQGCTTPPFRPKSDIRISSVSSASGSDEISANSTLVDGGIFPYEAAIIQFSINNGVGVNLTDLEIDYSPAEGEQISYIDGNGNPQTGIPSQKTKIQRHFNATIPVTEIPLSGAATAQPGVNVGDGTSRICCIFVNLVTRKAFEVISVDGNLLTQPNYNANIIANLTIRGVDDNENGFQRKAAIAITPNISQSSAEFDPGCDPLCSIGSRPTAAPTGGTPSGEASTPGSETTTP